MPATPTDAPLPIVRHALFDFGGPLLLTPFELNAVAARSMGVPVESLPRGPFDPAGDPRWTAWQIEEITERDYWSEKAAPFGLDIPGFMHHFFEPSGDHLVRPESWALVVEVQAAGKQAGLLTNDLSAFHGPAWRDPISVLKLVRPLVDLSMTGHLKPHPKAYAAAIDALGVAPGEIAFLDDQPYNVEGARRAGMAAVRFDPIDPAGSLAAFRLALAGR
jgi:putative hydrolase of the HAD superfamily